VNLQGAMPKPNDGKRWFKGLMEDPVKMKCGLMLGLAGIACLLVSGAMAAAIDFRDDFETYTNGQPANGTNGWGANSSDIQVFDAVGYSGTKGVQIPVDATLSNRFVSSGAKSVWSDFFVRPAFFVPTSTNILNPTVDTNSSAMFYFNSNGYLMVADLPSPSTTNWLKLNSSVSGAHVTPITESSWTRVSVFHQYSKSNFTVLVNGLLLREGMTNVNKLLTDYSKFQIYNGAGITAYVDQVNIVTSAPPADLVGDYDNDGMRDAWEIHFFGSTINGYTSTGDDDGDGFNNAEESAANSNPLDPSSMPVTVGLPYYESFDNRVAGNVNGKNGWTASGPDMQIQSAVKFAGTGQSLSLGLGSALLTNIVNSVTYTSVWTEFVMKRTPDLMYSNSAAAIFIDNNGYINAFNGSSWLMLTNYLVNGTPTYGQRVSNPAGMWARIVLHDDYISKKWSIWASTNALETNAMLRQVGKDLNFGANVSQYRGLRFINSASTAGYVDNVSITLTEPNFLDSDGDTVPDVYEAEHGLTQLDNNVRDSDGDGMTDKQEYIAGTDPNDPTSFLHILSLDLSGPGSANVRLVLNSAIDADVTVLGSPNPSGTRNPLGTFYTGFYGESNTFTHTSGATNTWFFYQVASSRRGSGVTNTEEFVGYMQPRTQGNKYYFVAVPIVGMTNLATELGTYLKRGLSVGDSAYILNDGSGTWAQFDLNSSMDWKVHNGPVVTDYPVAVGTGIRLYQRGAPTAVPRANFFGRRFTNTTVSVTVPQGWSFRAWPYDTTTSYAGATSAFGFPGGVGGTGTNDSDFIWTYRQDGALICLRMASNGKWYYYGTGIGEATGVQLNGGFWYFNHQSANMFWVPQRPQ